MASFSHSKGGKGRRKDPRKRRKKTKKRENDRTEVKPK